MSDPSIYVSNGTCYSAAGNKLDGSFIPCGNDAFGHVACCGAGDNCLEDLSCWGQHGPSGAYGTSLTYMAGCTDPDYKDKNCPNKHIDQPWIALTLCDNTKFEWAVCSQEGNPSTLKPGSFCSCTDASKTTIAFSVAESPIPSVASLPQKAGDSIQWFAGHEPTPASPTNGGGGGGGNGGGSSGGGNGGSSSNGGGGGSSTPTQTGSTGGSSGSGPGQSSGSSDSTALSTGAKVGIAVGAVVAALLILGALGFFLRSQRKRKREERLAAGMENGHGAAPSTAAGKTGGLMGAAKLGKKNRLSGTSTAPTVPEADGQAVLETDGTAAKPHNVRSELEGREVRPGMTQTGTGPGPWVAGTGPRGNGSGPPAELPGSTTFARPGGGGAPGTEPPQWGHGWRGET